MITGSFFAGLLAGLFWRFLNLRPGLAIIATFATAVVLILGAGKPFQDVIVVVIGATLGYFGALYVSPIKK